MLWIGLASAAVPSGAFLVGAAPGTDGEVTLAATGFTTQAVTRGPRFEGGLLEAHVDLHERATLTVGMAYDHFDLGVLPHLGVRGLIVNQEHVRFGFHMQSGAWLKLSEYDEYDDSTGAGVGWALQAGGDRVVFDIARTTLSVRSFESTWDGSRYWEPTRGQFQEIGVSFYIGEHHTARVGTLGFTPVGSYTYDGGAWFVKVLGGWGPDIDQNVYRGGLVSLGVRGQPF